MQGRMAGEGEAMKSWRRVFAETDVPNSMEGGNCYVWAKVRPRWYWFLRRVKLFLSIVWRPAWGDGRLDWRTAWEVSACGRGFTAKDTEEAKRPGSIPRRPLVFRGAGNPGDDRGVE